jgi:hypothetical protein
MSVAGHLGAPPQRFPTPIVVGAILLAVASGPLALLPTRAVLLLLGVALVATLVAVFPPLAAYLLLATTPLIVGIERGAVLPVVRPSEAVAGLVAGGLAARGLFEVVRGARLHVRPAPLDVAVIAFAITGSVLPLLWMVARGKAITQDDLLYALQPWKFAVVFLIVRLSIRTEREVTRCLQITLGAACVVGLIAILQSLQLLGVTEFLGAYYTDDDPLGLAVSRGSSTLSSSLAVGDFMTYSLAIAAAWLIRGGGSQWVLAPVGVICLLGVVASGQYSGFLAMMVAILALGIITGQLKRFLVASVCLLPVVVAVMWPVIANRLSGFQRIEGVPRSWSGRWQNLTEVFWPQLGHFNWVLGVRPAARLPAPEAWRDWIWIESGHTWLLWAGGVPFLIAFLVLLWCGFRQTAVTARRRSDAVGVAAAAAFTGLCVVTVLMTLDPHITARGSGDLLFSLLALSLVASAGATRGGSRPPPEAEPDQEQAG